MSTHFFTQSFSSLFMHLKVPYLFIEAQWYVLYSKPWTTPHSSSQLVSSSSCIIQVSAVVVMFCLISHWPYFTAVQRGQVIVYSFLQWDQSVVSSCKHWRRHTASMHILPSLWCYKDSSSIRHAVIILSTMVKHKFVCITTCTICAIFCFSLVLYKWSRFTQTHWIENFKFPGLESSGKDLVTRKTRRSSRK